VSEPLLLAQVSDTHIDGSERCTQRLRAVVEQLNSLRRLDLVVVTGDIADHGEPQEYALARRLLDRVEAPVHCLPGNHDERGAFRTGLGLPADVGPIDDETRLGQATVMMLDSTVPGEDGGWLADSSLERVRHAAPDRVLVICFHHPPVLLNSAIVDPIRQHGEDRLADVIADRTAPTYLLCGHAHVAAATTFAGVPLIIGPATSTRLGPDWDPAAGVLAFDAPPGYALHVLDGDRLTTHFRFG